MCGFWQLTFLSLFVFRVTHMYVHGYHFNSHFPDKPKSANRFFLDFQSPVIPILRFSWDRPKVQIPLTQSHQVFLGMSDMFPQSPSSYIAWTSMHHLYVEHVMCSSLVDKLTGSSPNNSLSSTFFSLHVPLSLALCVTAFDCVFVVSYFVKENQFPNACIARSSRASGSRMRCILWMIAHCS